MKQQYIVLRKENDELSSLIGKSYNQKMRDLAYQILCNTHKKANLKSPLKALVYCIDPEKNKILGVGGSSLMKDKKGKIVSDLINDNFGKQLAGFHRTPVNANKDVSYVLFNGTPNLNRVYTTTSQGWFAGYGGIIAIGSSSLAPTRSQFNVQTVFGSSPENQRLQLVSPSIYNSGTGKITGIATQFAPTGGSGTIRESALFVSLTIVGNHAIYTRDLITPNVSFVAGQTIVVDYTWQF